MAEANGTNGTMFGSELDQTPNTRKSRLTNSDYDQVFQQNMIQTMALPNKKSSFATPVTKKSHNNRSDSGKLRNQP